MNEHGQTIIGGEPGHFHEGTEFRIAREKYPSLRNVLTALQADNPSESGLPVQLNNAYTTPRGPLDSYGGFALPELRGEQ